MNDHDAYCWLYLWLLFCGGTEQEIVACGRMIAPLGSSIG